MLQKILRALDQYPSDHSPQYLQARLKEISDPGDMSDAVTWVTNEHDSLSDRLAQVSLLIKLKLFFDEIVVKSHLHCMYIDNFCFFVSF